MLLKPSERDPGAAMLITKLAQDAGVPDGVLNVVHGSVDSMCSSSSSSSNSGSSSSSSSSSG